MWKLKWLSDQVSTYVGCESRRRTIAKCKKSKLSRNCFKTEWKHFVCWKRKCFSLIPYSLLRTKRHAKWKRTKGGRARLSKLLISYSKYKIQESVYVFFFPQPSFDRAWLKFSRVNFNAQPSPFVPKMETFKCELQSFFCYRLRITARTCLHGVFGKTFPLKHFKRPPFGLWVIRVSELCLRLTLNNDTSVWRRDDGKGREWAKTCSYTQGKWKTVWNDRSTNFGSLWSYVERWHGVMKTLENLKTLTMNISSTTWKKNFPHKGAWRVNNWCARLM